MLTFKDLGPIGEIQVGGHNQGHPFVQGGAELEHQLGSGSGKRDEAQLIQHNEVVFEGSSQEFRQPLLFLSQTELVDQGSCVVKTNAQTLPAGRQGKASADMGFSVK